MIKGLSRSQHDLIVQSLTGGNNVLLCDDSGIPSAMVRVPMFLMSDVIAGAPSTPHPMFIVDGQVVPEIFIGKYLANIYKGASYSLPNRIPDNNVSFEDAIKSTAAKGNGWHVMTNAEHAGLSLLSKARGISPRGNTNNGSSYINGWESGVLVDGATTATSSSTKFDCGYLYDMYMIAKNGNTSNVYRIMGDKTYPLYDWNAVRNILAVCVDTNRNVYVMLDNGTVDVFNVDVKSNSFTIPDNTVGAMALNASGHPVIICKSGDLYEIAEGELSKVATVLSAAETDMVSMCFDPSGNIWIASSAAGTVYEYSPSTGKTSAYTGYAGIGQIMYHPNGYIVGGSRTENKAYLIALTNGGVINSFNTTYPIGRTIVDLYGNIYLFPKAGTSNVVTKIDTSLNLSTFTVSELTTVDNSNLSVKNSIYMSSGNKVIIYNNDAFYSHFEIGDSLADMPVINIGNNYSDATGLKQLRTFGLAATRYYLNQKFSYKSGAVNTRLYPYNAKTIHVTMTGDSTFTGKYNHIEFDVAGKTVNKLYFSVSGTDIVVKENDLAVGNVLAELANLSYNVAGDNVTNTDGVTISNVVKSFVTLDPSATVKADATITELVKYDNSVGVVSTSAIDNTPFYVKNSTRLKTRLNLPTISNAGALMDSTKYSTPIQVMGAATPVTGTIKTGYTPCIIKESDTSYKIWFTSANYTQIMYASSSDGRHWTNPIVVQNKGLMSSGLDANNIAMPYVIKDDGLYKMWYAITGSSTRKIAYSTSTDGINWSVPVSVNIDTTSYVYRPVVIKDGTTYKMWYAISTGTTGTYYWKIAYSTSTDGINWSSATLVMNTSGTSYNNANSNYPTVIKESDTSYKMWFCGSNSADQTDGRILYSTSTDGINWNTPILVLDHDSNSAGPTANLSVPFVLKESDGTYKIWFSATNSTSTTPTWYTMYSASSDGKVWSVPIRLDYGTVYNAISPIGWQFTTIKESDTSYKMWSVNYDSQNNTRIVCQTSTDGIKWSQPTVVMETGITIGTYVAKNYHAVTVVKDGSGYKMWMTFDDNSNVRIGFSTSVDGFNWTAPKLAMNIGTCSYNTSNNSTPCVIEDSSTFKMWFIGSVTTNGTTTYTNLYSTSADGITWSTPVSIGSLTNDVASIYKCQDGTYKMWLDSMSGNGIRYSTSPDGLTWSTPITVMNKGRSYEGYDNKYNGSPTVIVESPTSYKMWFIAGNTSTHNWALYSTSSDGINWSDPILAIAPGNGYPYEIEYIQQPKLMKDGNVYKMWFCSNGKLVYSTSTDCKNWSESILAIDIGTNANGYNKIGMGQGTCVIKDGDVYKLWASGDDGTNYRILYSTSKDGLVWSAPVLAVNIFQSYTVVGEPCVIKDRDSYKMWCHGYNGTKYVILYCTSSDGLTWSIPVVSVDIGMVIDGTTVTQVAHPAVYRDGMYYHMWIETNNGTFWKKIAYSKSVDGITWDSFTTAIDVNTSTGSPTSMGVLHQSVILDGNLVRMIFLGMDANSVKTFMYSEVKLPFLSGNVVETDIDSHELNLLTPTAQQHNANDWSAPFTSVVHGQFPSLADETYGLYGLASIIKESDTPYRAWAAYGSSTGSKPISITSIDGIHWNSVPVALNIPMASTLASVIMSVVKKPNGTYLMILGTYTASTGNANINDMCYSTSVDGINWSTPVKIITYPTGYAGAIQVSVIYHKGIYKMWASCVATDTTKRAQQIFYYESVDGVSWNYIGPVTFEGFTKLYSSFMYVAQYRNRLVACLGISSSGSYYDMYTSESEDGINWSIPEIAITRSSYGLGLKNTYVAPGQIIVDGDNLRVWFSSFVNSLSTVYYTAKRITPSIETDNGNSLVKVTNSLRLPKYMYGFSNTILNHDIIKVNGTYYLFFTKNTGSGYKVQMATSTDMKTWTTAVDVAVPTFDTTYKYGCSAPSVIRDNNVFKVVFQTFDSGYTGSVVYMTTSSDGVIWDAPTKLLSIGITTDCSKFIAHPCIMKDGATYKLWFLGHDGTNISVLQSTSSDAKNWVTPTKQMAIGTIASSKLFDGTQYLTVYKKSDGSGYRMLFTNGYSPAFADSTDGIAWGTWYLAYKYPMDMLSIGGQSSFRILNDDIDTKLTMLSFDGSGNTTITFRNYDDTTADFVEATEVEVQVLGDKYWKQKFFHSTYGNAIDSAVVKLAPNSYRGWFVYLAQSGKTVMYTATSTDGTNWTNFTLAIDASATTDTLLGTYFRKPSVVKDGASYKMWLSTTPTSSSAGYDVVYLTSNDGISWSTSSVCLGDGTTNLMAKVIKDGSTYKAWTFIEGKTSNTVSYYESSDGVVWTQNTADVIKSSTFGANYTKISLESISKVGKEYRAYIAAISLSLYDHYYATSTDGIVWYIQKQVTYPKLSSYGNQVSAGYNFEVMFDGSRIFLVYNVAPLASGTNEFCAICSEDGLTFGRANCNTVTTNSITITKGGNNNALASTDFETVEVSPFYNFNSGDRFRVDFKGAPEYINAANALKLKLELFGGAGASQGSYNGGKGGYTYGAIDTTTLKKLVLMVGGIGGYNKSTYGFNGGGMILDSKGYYYHGGGATDIRTSYSDITRRLIVAAGGGSADASDGTTSSGHSGGNGGGWVGIDGVGVSIGKGGTQTAGGKCSLTNLAGWTNGICGNGAIDAVTTADVATFYGAGGAGYYGAGNGSQGAGGGSSYVSGNLNCPSYHPDSIVLTESGTSMGYNNGNGYAVITVVTTSSSDGSKRTLNGSGPVTWNDTQDATGIADLVGNLNSMVTGLKLSSKNFYVIKDNDAAMMGKDLTPESKDWKMIDANGNYITTGTGISLNYSSDFSSVDFSALAVTGNPYLAKALGLAPADSATGTGYVNGKVNDEYYPLRGGYYGSLALAGMFNMSFISKYGDMLPYAGFRIAYYKPL